MGPGGRPRARIAAPSAAVPRTSASFDLAAVLQEAADTARALTAARYGIVTTVDEAGAVREHVTSGFTEAEHRQFIEWGRTGRSCSRIVATFPDRCASPISPRWSARLASPRTWCARRPSRARRCATAARPSAISSSPIRKGLVEAHDRARVRGRRRRLHRQALPSDRAHRAHRGGASRPRGRGAVRARRARHRPRAAPGDGGRARGGADGHRVRDPAHPPGRRRTGGDASESLLRQAWYVGEPTDTERVRTFVKQLRANLGDDAALPAYIFNERGVGYRMARPGEE